MKKSLKFSISGSIQPVFYNRFIKDNADRLGVKGFVRDLKNGKAEIFIEGSTEAIEKMAPICRRGPQHSLIREIQEKEEKFQDFKDFKILNF
jgi:acylphosphatase